ncbi:MAG: SH3 domain-containing protein, partial [Holdemanella sp.]|nr:SH3 domain-containing protein [Holdemanella sp.]
SPKNKVPYLVRIVADGLYVRSGAGTSFPHTTIVHKGEVYTIVEEVDGWGKLKSGAGWISLKYTEKV